MPLAPARGRFPLKDLVWNRGGARFARRVGAFVKPAQRSVDVIEHSLCRGEDLPVLLGGRRLRRRRLRLLRSRIRARIRFHAEDSSPEVLYCGSVAQTASPRNDPSPQVSTPERVGTDNAAPGSTSGPLLTCIGAGTVVPCLDGEARPYRDLDCAASTPASAAVARRVDELLERYSSVHRGTGFKSRATTASYEAARHRILEHCGRSESVDIAIMCRNATEALNHLAYQLHLERDDVVVTTVIEHHANLLPWGRYARRRYVECTSDGTFELEDVCVKLDKPPRPKLLAITGASNVTGWLPPLDAICDAAHERGVPVVVDAAQLAPHRPISSQADFVVWSGHKMYAPFGGGALVGPRGVFARGEPFLAGGGAVDLVSPDDVVWTAPPDREEAGTPNVVGAVAIGAALDELECIGWEVVRDHDKRLRDALLKGLGSVSGVHTLGCDVPGSLPVVPFTVDGMHHALVAARLAVEHGIGVRHGCFCAHPYVVRLLQLGCELTASQRTAVMNEDRTSMPGAARVSCGLSTTDDDVAALVHALEEIISTPPPVPYHQHRATGDYTPVTDASGWWS